MILINMKNPYCEKLNIKNFFKKDNYPKNKSK